MISLAYDIDWLVTHKSLKGRLSIIAPDGMQVSIEGAFATVPESDHRLLYETLVRITVALNCDDMSLPSSVDLYLRPRVQQPASSPDWLEYGVNYQWPGGARRLYIACIQRWNGAECEFHS